MSEKNSDKKRIKNIRQKNVVITLVSAAALFALLGRYPPCGATAFSPLAGSSSRFPYCILPGRMIH